MSGSRSFVRGDGERLYESWELMMETEGGVSNCIVIVRGVEYLLKEDLSRLHAVTVK